MKRGSATDSEVDESRRVFLEKHGSSPENTVLVQLNYDSSDFCRYDVVDKSAAGEGIVRDGRIADGLATKEKGLALFLPLADCIGAVLFDPEHEAVMLTHLGRHNIMQNGGRKSVEFMVKQFSTNPAQLEVWFSPSAGAENYPLFTFENKGMGEVAAQQFAAAGVQPGNIEQSTIDTTKDERYFSHSEFLKGNRSMDGRFTVIAMMQ